MNGPLKIQTIYYVLLTMYSVQHSYVEVQITISKLTFSFKGIDVEDDF